VNLPKDNNILKKDEEHKDDADTHPDIQGSHIAHFWGVLSAIITSKHNSIRNTKMMKTHIQISRAVT
jgi:hypothetical protein